MNIKTLAVQTYLHVPNISVQHMSSKKDGIFAETIFLYSNPFGFVLKKVIHRQDCTAILQHNWISL